MKMKEKRFIDAWESPDIDIQWRKKVLNDAVSENCLYIDYYIYDIDELDSVMKYYVDAIGFSAAYNMISCDLDLVDEDFFIVVEPVVGEPYIYFLSHEELYDLSVEDDAEKGVIEFFKHKNIPFDEILNNWH